MKREDALKVLSAYHLAVVDNEPQSKQNIAGIEAGEEVEVFWEMLQFALDLEADGAISPLRRNSERLSGLAAFEEKIVGDLATAYIALVKAESTQERMGIATWDV